MAEFSVYEQEKSSILRVFRSGAAYGEPFLFSLYVSYYGKHNSIALLEGLDREITGEQRRALVDHFSAKGVRQVKWDHKDKCMCYDTVERKLRIE